jgi:hypothetical protein
MFLRFTVTFAVGLELTVALLGHPSGVPLVLPVVGVGVDELPLEPVPDPVPPVVPQAESNNASPMTSETTIKSDVRFDTGSVRIRVTPFIPIALDFP